MRAIIGWVWRRHSAGVRQGQSLILFALLLPVMIGFTGLALDAGNVYFQRRLLQRAADAAALTGAQVANFDPERPEILDPEGPDQARVNVLRNLGNSGDTIVTRVRPQAGPYADILGDGNYDDGERAYIEVTISRNVTNPFMQLFGLNSSTITTRAVARCYVPGYGNPALLALNGNNSDAITFNGCGGSGCRVEGDIMSYGGVNPNGTSVSTSGSTYALNGPISGPITYTNGGDSFSGTENQSVDLLNVDDPTLLPTFQWPAWPAASMTITATTSGSNLGCAEYREDPPGPDPAIDTTDCDGSVRVRSDHEPWSGRSEVVIRPGTYSGNIEQDTAARPLLFDAGGTVVNGNVTLHENATIDADLWVKGDLIVNGAATFNGRVRVDGTVSINGSGSATFNGDVLFNGDLGVSGTAVLHPGTYDDVSVSGTVEFLTGVYDFRTLAFGSSAYGWTAEPTSTTAVNGWDNSGVVFRLLGPSEDVANCMTSIGPSGPPAGFDPATCYDDTINVLDITGGTQLNLHVLNRNTIPPLSPDPYNNTYNNFLFYAPFNSLDLTGTGNRDIDGSIYAPHGNVDISGDGGDAVIEGQVVANQIRLSGNGSLISYYPSSPKITFGPVLVNTPRSDG